MISERHGESPRGKSFTAAAPYRRSGLRDGVGSRREIGKVWVRIPGNIRCHLGVPSEEIVSFMLPKGSDVVEAGRGASQLPQGRTRKGYRINFPSSEVIVLMVLSPWVCCWSPCLVPLVTAIRGLEISPLFSPQASLQVTAEAKFPNPPDHRVTLANTFPHRCPLSLGSSLSRD